MFVIFSISVSSLTSRAAIIAGLAITVMLLIGWRKPVRAEHRTPRWGNRTGIVVDQLPTPTYRRTSLIHRVFSLAVSGALAVLIGVLLAIIVAFGISAAVIYMTNLLGS